MVYKEHCNQIADNLMKSITIQGESKMIEILKFEMVNKGALVARFSVKMHKWGGLIIKDCSLLQSGDKKWINLPSRQYEVDGKKKYAEHLGYEDRTLNDQFKDNIMKAAEECKARSTFVPEAPNQYDDEVPF